jgi:hypothetical protein
MPEVLPEMQLADDPDRMVMLVDDLAEEETQVLASQAVDSARMRMPRVSGHMATTLQTLAGPGYFGIYFPDRRIWYMEHGTSPFTMNRLPRGKPIPMWVNDQDGSQAREIRRTSKKPPQTRTTLDGRRQVLIFRVVAPDRSRKLAVRRGKLTDVPRSYPGAPGRISARSQRGQIATGNVGVRWRHPGITARMFLNSAIAGVALDNGIEPVALYLCDTATFFTLVER